MSGLATYLPASIVEYYIKNEENVAKPPFRHRYRTVALFADVSGYTAMCEAMSELGQIGDEMLARHLNSYYEQLVRIVSKEGGDVFKFAGDAIIVLWPESEDELETLTRRAAQCALEIDNQMQNIRMSDDVVLCIKVGVGIGDLSILHVGGVFNRLEYVAIGIPLVQAFNAEHHIVAKEAKPNGNSLLDKNIGKTGQVVMSPEAWEIVKDYFVAEIKDEHAFLKSCKKRLTSQSIAYTAGGGQTLHERTVAKLKNYVPSAVMPWLDVKEEKWASELRLITVLFVNLGLSEPELLRIAKEDDIDTVQTILEVVQQAVYRFEGSLNKFLMDDKGSTLLAVFGLPPLAHEDDSVRGILAAINIVSSLRKLRYTASCGISSGRAYCGIVGNRVRREYSVLGDTVNLAARLMQHATSNKIQGGVVCDLSTQYLARHRFQFDPLQSIKVKGKSAQISLYRPLPKIRSKDPWALHGMIKPVGKSTHSSDRDKETEEERKLAGAFTPSSAEESLSFLRMRETSFIDDAEPEADVSAINVVMSRLTGLRDSGAPFNEWFPRKIEDVKEVEEGVGHSHAHLSTSSIPNEFVINVEREDQILRHTRTLLAAHSNLVNTGKGVTMIIQGEMGMGKSRLLFSFLQEIPRSNSTIVTAEGNPFDVHTPLSVWRDILLQLLDSRIPDVPVEVSMPRMSLRNGRAPSAVDRVDRQKSGSFLKTGRLSAKTVSIGEKSREFSPMVVVEEEENDVLWVANARRSLILRILKGRLQLDECSLESLAAVLNSVLPTLQFRESAFSEGLDMSMRIKYAKNLLSIIFASFARHSPCVIAIEDAVFLDHESWNFLLQLSRLQLRVLFILATRPINKLYMSAFATSVPEAYLQLLREPLTVVLQLERWSSEEIMEISKSTLAEILGCDRSTIDVPAKLLELLRSKAQGCPLVIKELVWSLKKKGLIGIMPLASPTNRQREIVVSPSLIGHSTRESDLADTSVGAKDLKAAGTNRKIINKNRFHQRGTIDAGIVYPVDKEIAEHKSKDDESVVPVPMSLQSVLGCQLDRLTPTQSMTLKTGAVAAFAFAKSCFSLQWLIEVYPVSYPDYNSLKRAILALVDLKIIEPVRENANSERISWEISYSFTHGFMRDMILSRMLSAQKVTIAAELHKARGLERLPLAPKLEPASIVGPLYVLMYGDSLGRPDELADTLRELKERRNTNMSVFVDEHTLEAKKEEHVRWAEVNPSSAAWGVAWFSLHGGALVMWPSEQAAQAADDPHSEHQPLVVIFPREASVSELMQWVPGPKADEKDSELVGGGPTIKHLRDTLPQQLRTQKQEFTFLLRARYFMWDGDYYHQTPLTFQVGASTLKEAEAWLGNLRTGIGAYGATPPPEQQALSSAPVGLKELQVQEEANLNAEIESKQQNIMVQPTCLLVQKQSGYVKFAGLWKKSWITLTNQALYIRKKHMAITNPKWLKPNSVLNLMTGEPQAKIGQLDTQKNKIYTFNVNVDMWRKGHVSFWERRTFVFGCEKAEEAQKWVSFINRVIGDNVSRKQGRSPPLPTRTTFGLDAVTAKNNLLEPKHNQKDANWARRVPSHHPHEHETQTEMVDEHLSLLLEGKIQLNPRQKKKVWERGAHIMGLIDHALKLTESTKKSVPLQTADPEGDVHRIQMGIILRDCRAWASTVLSSNMAPVRGRTGSFLSSTFGGNRGLDRGGRWMEKNFEDLVGCVDDTSREWLSQVYTKRKTLDFSHAPLIVGPYRSVKVSTSYPIESWENFDVFAFNEKEMIPVVIAILDSFDIPRGLNMPRDTLVNWLSAVQLMYGNNPYHNFRHAVDVCQTTYVLLRTKRMEHLSLLEKSAMLIAALCHDLGHPGLTNEYHKNALSELALVYNDRSVLENHHCSQTFRLFKRPELNIFVNLPVVDFAYMRSLILTLILSTDNSNHFKLFRKLTGVFDADSYGDDEEEMIAKPSTLEETEERKEERRIIMCGILHAADISNPCKPWPLSSRWSQNILEEFFLQGDLEKAKGLKISPNCDRVTTVPVELSLNFLDFIVAPLFLSMGRWMAEGVWVNLMKENRKELERRRAAQSNGIDAQKWSLREESFARLLLTSRRHSTTSDRSSTSDVESFEKEKSHTNSNHKRDSSLSQEPPEKKDEETRVQAEREGIKEASNQRPPPPPPASPNSASASASGMSRSTSSIKLSIVRPSRSPPPPPPA